MIRDPVYLETVTFKISKEHSCQNGNYLISCLFDTLNSISAKSTSRTELSIINNNRLITSGVTSLDR